jgi:hypothetical protein
MNKILLICLTFLSISSVFAAGVPSSFTYEGKVLNSAGTAPLTSVVSFKLSIYDPTGTCLLYQEQQANIDLSQTNGLFAVQVGSAIGAAKRVGGADQGLAMTAVFANNGQILAASTTGCTAGYTPAANDIRLLRVAVTNGGSTVTISPDLQINAVPNALVAETVQGVSLSVLNPTGMVISFTGPTCPTGYLTADGTSYQATTFPALSTLYKNNLIYIYGGTVAGGSFSVPDFRGLFLRGLGTNSAIAASNGSSLSSAAQGAYQTDQLQGHYHGSLNGAFVTNTSGGIQTGGSVLGTAPTTGSPVSDGTNGTPRTGAETRPANTAVNYCIKY